MSKCSWLSKNTSTRHTNHNFCLRSLRLGNASHFDQCRGNFLLDSEVEQEQSTGIMALRETVYYTLYRLLHKATHVHAIYSTSASSPNTSIILTCPALFLSRRTLPSLNLLISFCKLLLSALVIPSSSSLLPPDPGSEGGGKSKTSLTWGLLARWTCNPWVNIRRRCLRRNNFSHESSLNSSCFA